MNSTPTDSRNDTKRTRTDLINYGYAYIKLRLACKIFNAFWDISLNTSDDETFPKIVRASERLGRALAQSHRFKELELMKDFFKVRNAKFAADWMQYEATLVQARVGSSEETDTQMASIKNVRTRRHARTEVVREKIKNGKLTEAFAEIPTISNKSERLELFCDLVEASALSNGQDTEEYLVVAHEYARTLPKPTIDEIGNNSSHPLEKFACSYLFLGREEDYLTLVLNEEEALIRDHLLDHTLSEWLYSHSSERFPLKAEMIETIVRHIRHPLFVSSALISLVILLQFDDGERAMEYLSKISQLLADAEKNKDSEWFDKDLHSMNLETYTEKKEYFDILHHGRMLDLPKNKYDLIVDVALDRGDFLYALRVAKKSTSAHAYTSIIMRYMNQGEYEAALEVCRTIANPNTKFRTASSVVIRLCAHEIKYTYIMPFIEFIEKVDDIDMTQENLCAGVIVWSVFSSYIMAKSYERLSAIDADLFIEFFTEALMEKGDYMLAGTLLIIPEDEHERYVAMTPLDKQKRIRSIIGVIQKNPFENI